jgi:hypothetical protein
MGIHPMRDLFRVQSLFVASMLLGLLPLQAQQSENRWWPVQGLPRTLVRIANPSDAPESNTALQMMVQSLAGLAAKAVNEGRGDELVWVDTVNQNLKEWLVRLREAHPQVQDGGLLKPWELVDRYSNKGIVKGYILFRLDGSPGEPNAHRKDMDCSVNSATSMAGVLNGIIVAEELSVRLWAGAEARRSTP